MIVQVWLEDQPAAEVSVGPDGAPAGLRYRREWSTGLRAYPLSPRLSLHSAAPHAAFAAAPRAASATSTPASPAASRAESLAASPAEPVNDLAKASAHAEQVPAAPSSQGRRSTAASELAASAGVIPGASGELATYLNALRPGGLAEAGLRRALGRVVGDALLPVLIAAGDDLPGAVSLRDTQAPRRAGRQLRMIPVTEMVERLRGPVDESLLLASVDGAQVLPWWPAGSADRPRVGVYLDQGQWWWTRTPQLASTHLLEAPGRWPGEEGEEGESEGKSEGKDRDKDADNDNHEGKCADNDNEKGRGKSEGKGKGGEQRLFNRFFCLGLAARLGLDVAPVELLKLPMPVLQFQRWDRMRMDDGRVQRFHAVSVAQALGLRAHPVGRGDSGDGTCHAATSPVEAIPTASATERWKQLGALLDLSPQPLVDRRALIRWWIFQTLTGHTAARPDELWCYLDHAGLRWAPVMDLICPSALDATSPLTPEPSMVPPSESAHDWAMAAKSCGAPPRILANELRRMCEAAPQEAQALAEALADEVPQDVMQGVMTVVSENAARHLAWVDDLLHTDHRD